MEVPSTEVKGSGFPVEDALEADGAANTRNSPDDDRPYANSLGDPVDAGETYPTKRTSVSNGIDAIKVPSGTSSSSSSSSSSAGSCHIHANRSPTAAEMNICADSGTGDGAQSREMTGEA